MEIKRVEMLAAVERLPGSKYLCKCDCGGSRVVNIGHFHTGAVKSCGCHVVRHGHSGVKAKSSTYISWGNMIARCHNPKNKRYGDYGSKGITVCERWRKSFATFLRDMGPMPEGMQIDRMNNERGYFPGNCRWATPKQNMANRSITQVWILHGKHYISAGDASEVHHCSVATINAWCKGRTAKGRYYPPRAGCGIQPATHAILKKMGLLPADFIAD